MSNRALKKENAYLRAGIQTAIEMAEATHNAVDGLAKRMCPRGKGAPLPRTDIDFLRMLIK